MNQKPVILIGAGSHAKVLMDTLLLKGRKVLGLVDQDLNKQNSCLMGYKVLGNDDVLTEYSPEAIELVNCIGSTSSTGARRMVFEAYKRKGYTFSQVIHPGSIISRNAQLGEGVQIMAGVVIQVDSLVGDNCILNTHASIDHDCKISNHVHIAPGTILSGGGKVGEGSHLGTGVSVIQNRVIGCNVLVAAGSVVTRDIPDGVRVKGVPAEIF